MKQLTRQELQALANLHMTNGMEALDKAGCFVVVLVAPKVDPPDGKAVICTNADLREVPELLLKAAKQSINPNKKKTWPGVVD